MIDFNLRCGQLMAERSERNRTNFIESSRLHYRLERIGQAPQPQPEPQVIFKRRPVDNDIDQLKGRLIHLENKLVELYEKRKKPAPKPQPSEGVKL